MSRQHMYTSLNMSTEAFQHAYAGQLQDCNTGRFGACRHDRQELAVCSSTGIRPAWSRLAQCYGREQLLPECDCSVPLALWVLSPCCHAVATGCLPGQKSSSYRHFVCICSLLCQLMLCHRPCMRLLPLWLIKLFLDSLPVPATGQANFPTCLNGRICSPRLRTFAL